MEPLVTPPVSSPAAGSSKKKIIIGVLIAVVLAAGGYLLYSGSSTMYKGSGSGAVAGQDCKNTDGVTGKYDQYGVCIISAVPVEHVEVEECLAAGTGDQVDSSNECAWSTEDARLRYKCEHDMQSWGTVGVFSGGACTNPNPPATKLTTPVATRVATSGGASGKSQASGEQTKKTETTTGTQTTSGGQTKDVEQTQKTKTTTGTQTTGAGQTTASGTANAVAPHITSENDEMVFRLQMLEQQLAIQKENAAKAEAENELQRAQREREEQAAAFARAGAIARGELVEPLDNTVEASTTTPIVETPLVGGPIVEAVVAPTVEETNNEAVPSVSASARVSAAAASDSPTAAIEKSKQPVNVSASKSVNASASNSRVATSAGSSNGLHGAAIRGESGPEALLYPVLLGLAQGTYVLIKRRRK